jgi:hypothetical protein
MLTTEFVKRYLREYPPTHKFYRESIEIHERICVHADGEYPKELIEVARPNEADEYKAYRQQVYTPVTKTWHSKVVKTITKGHRAEDWGITWKKDNKGAVPKDETLQQYTTVNYPYFDSVENWAFSIALPSMLNDPDGVIAVYPLPKQTDSDTEYLRPYTNYFSSKQVIDFKDGEFAVLLDEKKSIVTVKDEQVEEGMIFHFFDENQYWYVVQIGEKDSYRFTINIDQNGNEISFTQHNAGHLPVFKLGGVIKEFCDGNILWDSFISDCVNNWNEAVRRYSDHQVNMVLHLHPFEWEIMDTPCKVCSGTGKQTVVWKEIKETHTCGACQGSGNVSVKTPFGKKLIRPSSKTGPNDSIAIPTPPAGIIERDIGSIDFLKKEYESQIREGLAAINMEWIMDVPLTTSGISKEKDREEATTFFHEVYRHFILNVLYPSYYFIAKWRYPTATEEEVEYNMPSIKIPVKFDLVTAELVGEKLKTAIESKFNPMIVNKLSIEYAKKELGDDAMEIKKLETILQMDPLPNKTVDEKMTDLSSQSISIESYILSENINGFIERAMSEDEKFLNKTYAEKTAVFNVYIKEVMDSNARNIIPMVANG